MANEKKPPAVRQVGGFFERTVLDIDQRATLLGRVICVNLIDVSQAAWLAAAGESNAERRRVTRLAFGPKTVLCLAECRT